MVGNSNSSLFSMNSLHIQLIQDDTHYDGKYIIERERQTDREKERQTQRENK